MVAVASPAVPEAGCVAPDRPPVETKESFPEVLRVWRRGGPVESWQPVEQTHYLLDVAPGVLRVRQVKAMELDRGGSESSYVEGDDTPGAKADVDEAIRLIEADEDMAPLPTPSSARVSLADSPLSRVEGGGYPDRSEAGLG